MRSVLIVAQQNVWSELRAQLLASRAPNVIACLLAAIKPRCCERSEYLSQSPTRYHSQFGNCASFAPSMPGCDGVIVVGVESAPDGSSRPLSLYVSTPLRKLFPITHSLLPLSTASTHARETNSQTHRNHTYPISFTLVTTPVRYNSISPWTVPSAQAQSASTTIAPPKTMPPDRRPHQSTLVSSMC